MRAILLILFAVLLGLSMEVKSQDFLPDEEDVDILYRRELYGGVLIHTNGWGVTFRKGKALTGFKKRMWEVDLVTMKHPKEIKAPNPFFPDSRSYVYGKLNDLVVLRGGIGIQREITGKPSWGGVEFRYYYGIGASIGLAKPVYLKILHYTAGYPYPQTVVEKYDPVEHSIETIHGKAPIGKGLNELKPYPGAHVKGALNFEFGAFDENVRAVEVGAILDAYAKPIPIMAFNKNIQYFLTLYASVNFGVRKN